MENIFSNCGKIVSSVGAISKQRTLDDIHIEMIWTLNISGILRKFIQFGIPLLKKCIFCISLSQWQRVSVWQGPRQDGSLNDYSNKLPHLARPSAPTFPFLDPSGLFGFLSILAFVVCLFLSNAHICHYFVQISFFFLSDFLSPPNNWNAGRAELNVVEPGQKLLFP